MTMTHHKVFKRTIAHAWYTDNDPFKLFNNTLTTVTPKELNKNHILFLWGGEDIATEIYGETPCDYVRSKHKSLRDIIEIDLFHKAVDLQIPIIGICRGAQLITCLTGGSLIQHIEEHDGGNHAIMTHNNETLVTNSCHHQMMVPNPQTSKILANSIEYKNTFGLRENNKKVIVDLVPEIVHFPDVNALGIQGHPEWPSMPKITLKYCTNLIKDLILNE